MRRPRGLRAIASRLRSLVRSTPRFETSATYWEERYRAGGTSGAGSYNQLASFKASYINSVAAERGVKRTIEFGCGDGNQLGYLTLEDYVGVDVSQTAIDLCRRRYGDDPSRRFFLREDEGHWRNTYDLALSLDVIYHLVEDDVFHEYMASLFSSDHRMVLVYSSNYDELAPVAHVRHRRFTDWVTAQRPDWRLEEHTPNPYPFDPDAPESTTFAEFFLFESPA
jgi:SAM-dependent methyltransferase